MQSALFISTEESMEADSGSTSKVFVDASSQTDDFNVIPVIRSDSINMIVDSTVTTSVATSKIETAPTIHSTPLSLALVASHVSIPFYRLSASNARCSVYDVDFSSNIFELVFSNDIRTRAFLERDALISFGTRCYTKHISDGYLYGAALQRIRKKEKTCILAWTSL